MLTGWLDTKLGVSRTFDTASDGVLRCLPGTSTFDFADAQCTQVVWFVGCGSPSPYANVSLTISQSACGSTTGTAVYAIGSGGPFTPPALWSRIGSNCTQLSVPVTAPVVAYPTEVPPSTFVAATTTKLVPFGDGTLAARLLEAEDGASQVVAITQAKTGIDCAPLGGFLAAANPYADVCWPSTLSFYGVAQVYSDSACTQLVPYVAGGSSGNDACSSASSYPDAGLVWSLGCSGTNPVGESLGAPRVVPGLYTGSATSCSPIAAGDTVVPYGPVIPPSTFPALHLERVGSGRLRVESYVDDSGQPLLLRLENVSMAFFDTQLGQICSPQTFADGQRCTTTAAFLATDTFADPQCTTPLATDLRSSQDPCSQPPLPPYVVVQSGVGCASVQKTYALGARVTPSTVYQSSGSSCVASSAGATAYYALTLRDDTVWAPLTARTEQGACRGKGTHAADPQMRRDRRAVVE